MATAAVPARRVLIFSSNVGEGHIAAARALAAELALEASGVEVEIVDAFSVLGRALRFVMLDAYRWQLKRAPWMFGLLYSWLTRSAASRRLGERGIVLFGRRRMLALFRQWQPDVVVSTYPIMTTLLGHLRERGTLRVPVYATITDLGGLVFWAHRGIDLHLMMSESSVEQVNEILGKQTARCVRPLVAAEFFKPRGVAEARAALGLPTGSPVVVISGGGWGVGDIEGATRTVLQFPGAQIVCLAGRDEEARRRLAGAFAHCSRVRVEGFVNKMSDLLAAASALVHSTGGVTVLEAAVRGCPTVSYGEPPGHLSVVVEEMVSHGLVEHASSPAQLLEIITAMIHNEGRRPIIEHSAPSAASLVLALENRLSV